MLATGLVLTLRDSEKQSLSPNISKTLHFLHHIIMSRETAVSAYWFRSLQWLEESFKSEGLKSVLLHY